MLLIIFVFLRSFVISIISNQRLGLVFISKMSFSTILYITKSSPAALRGGADAAALIVNMFNFCGLGYLDSWR